MAVKPPRPRGPHLNAMRAFEAAARCGGFSAAADELHVTPAAISQQIKALEDWTGARLFARHGQGVSLTPLGQTVARDFTSAFDALGDALQGLRAHAARNSISIAALPAVAQLWLAPRLPALRRDLDAFDISVTALETPPNLRREMFDLSLFMGVPTDDPREQILAQDTMLPVCAPDIAARLNSPADLAQETLLHDAVWRDDWAIWLAAAGQPVSIAADGPVHSLYSFAVQEAENGAGVLIGHTALIADGLENGTLVAPFDLPAVSGKALIATVAPTPVASPGLAALSALVAGHEAHPPAP